MQKKKVKKLPFLLFIIPRLYKIKTTDDDLNFVSLFVNFGLYLGQLFLFNFTLLTKVDLLSSSSFNFY